MDECGIYGVIQSEDTLYGKIEGIGEIRGEVEAEGFIVGEVGFPECPHYNDYEGDYTVTPTKQQQVLHTDDMLMSGDVTIEPIPSEYIIPQGTLNIVENGRKNVHDYSEVEVNVPIPPGYIIPSGSQRVTENDTYNITELAEVIVDVNPSLQNKRVTPAETEQTVEADSNYYGLDKVTVEPMPRGTEGTPTASKGAVSNHSIEVVPSVVNARGFIEGGTKQGLGVVVSVDELVSGTKLITANGVGIDVTEFESVNVDVPPPLPTLEQYVIRPDAELLRTYQADRMMVADDGIEIPAYSTTSKTVKASANLSPTITMDITNYKYYLVERMLTIPIYNIDTIAKGREEYAVSNALYEIAEIPANEFKALVNDTKITARNMGAAGMVHTRMPYWSAATTFALYTSTSYGVHQVGAAPGISGSTLTPKTPSIALRGHTTYFTSQFFGALTDIRYQYVIEVYRSPKNHLNIDGWGTEQSMLHSLDCINNNNLILT